VKKIIVYFRHLISHIPQNLRAISRLPFVVLGFVGALFWREKLLAETENKKHRIRFDVKIFFGIDCLLRNKKLWEFMNTTL
jgi:hypothetical protein